MSHGIIETHMHREVCAELIHKVVKVRVAIRIRCHCISVFIPVDKHKYDYEREHSEHGKILKYMRVELENDNYRLQYDVVGLVLVLQPEWSLNHLLIINHLRKGALAYIRSKMKTVCGITHLLVRG